MNFTSWKMSLLACLLWQTAACAQHTSEKQTFNSDFNNNKAHIITGKASYYSKKFHGRTTASGEPFNMYALTAAHRTLKFGTVVRVTNPKNGRSVIVRINDRGPSTKNRVIDLSYAAAKKIGMIQAGVLTVKIENNFNKSTPTQKRTSKKTSTQKHSGNRTHIITGKASYYSKRFHGRTTASGEPFNMYAMTAAHRTLKFGTVVQVTNPKNGRSVIVRINDRGPFTKNRVIDLSYAAAKKIGMIQAGVLMVKVEEVK